MVWFDMFAFSHVLQCFKIPYALQPHDHMFDTGLMQILWCGALAGLHLLGLGPKALGSGLQPFKALTFAQLALLQ